MRSEYVVPDSFVAVRGEQSCVLDSWVSGASDSGFSVVANSLGGSYVLLILLQMTFKSFKGKR